MLTARTDDGGHLVGRVFLSDGATPGAGFTVFVGSYSRDTGRLEAIDQTTTDATGTFAFARSLPAERLRRRRVRRRQRTARRRAGQHPAAAHDVGQHRARSHWRGRGRGLQRQRPAAGGRARRRRTSRSSQTDVNGFFRIEGVPAGPRTHRGRRSGHAPPRIRAGRRPAWSDGDARRSRLESRATITGRVLDANGIPVPARDGPHSERRRLHVRLRERQRRLHASPTCRSATT